MKNPINKARGLLDAASAKETAFCRAKAAIAGNKAEGFVDSAVFSVLVVHD